MIDRTLGGSGRQEGDTVLQSLHYQHQVRIPDLLVLGIMIADYNCKHLTYECDRFDAFAGVAKLLSRAFGQLQSGLPERFLDVALLWQPESEDSLSAVGTLTLTTLPQGRRKHCLVGAGWDGSACSIMGPGGLQAGRSHR